MCLNLLFMRRGGFFHRFNLCNNFPFHNYISPESLIKLKTFELNRDRNLSLNLQSAILQFFSENDFIDNFEETRSKFAMNSDRRFNNDCSNLIFSHIQLLPEKKYFVP